MAFNSLVNHFADNSNFTPEEVGKIAAGALGIVVAITVVVSIRQAVDSIKDIVKRRKGRDRRGRRNRSNS